MQQVVNISIICFVFNCLIISISTGENKEKKEKEYDKPSWTSQVPRPYHGSRVESRLTKNQIKSSLTVPVSNMHNKQQHLILRASLFLQLLKNNMQSAMLFNKHMDECCQQVPLKILCSSSSSSSFFQPFATNSHLYPCTRLSINRSTIDRSCFRFSACFSQCKYILYIFTNGSC